MTKRVPLKPLGELCAVIGGGTPSKSNPSFYSGTIPWATVRDMHHDILKTTEHRITREAVASNSTNIIPSGNVVIATRVGLGKVCILAQDTAINQDLRGIIPLSKNELNVRYLFWWLKSMSDVIIAEGTGATVQGVKLPFIKSLEIPLHTLVEQERIVSLLDEAFEGIAIVKANAEKKLDVLEDLKNSLLTKAFLASGDS
jgi:type I restriction enzyme S subunit